MLWPEALRALPEPLWLWLIIAGLAAWRITSILHHERIAEPVRKLIGVREIEPSANSTLSEVSRFYPDTFLGQLFECFLCLSVWVGLIMLVVLVVFPLAMIPLAISALAIFAQMIIFEN